MITSNNKGITCPNHGCPLEDLGFPVPKRGSGTCPVSGAKFDYVIEADDDTEEIKLDKFGNVMKAEKITVTGEEN